MRVLLTGAFGYFGGRIADSLRSRGVQVVLAGRQLPEGARRWAKAYEQRSFDVLDAPAVLDAVRGVDAIAHLAALDEREAVTEPQLARRVSEEGSVNLLRAADAHGCRRLVFFSTFHVYGPVGDVVIDETLPARPVHPYATAHFAGEEACRLHSGACAAVSLRISNGYGAPVWRDVDRWTLAHNDFCRQAVTTGTIRLASTGTQHRDFVWVEDVAHALELVLAASGPEQQGAVFNVGGGSSLSIFDLAQRVRAVAERVLNKSVSIERPALTGDEQLQPVRFSTAKLSALGYAPRDRIDLESERILVLLTDG